ncbi:MAG: NfeD family protein [Pseudomonadota bacterium]
MLARLVEAAIPFLFSAWMWAAAALVLAAFEAVVPGVYLVWLAFAAGGVAIITYVFDPGWVWQVAFFGLTTVAMLILGQRYTRPDDQDRSPEAQGLNLAGIRLIGRSVSITEAVKNGEGRAKVGDSEWSVRANSDIPVGDRVRVVGMEGTTLVVEQIE